MARTKVDAINACLRGVGIAAIGSEDDDDLDAATASETIDQVSHDLQSRGWWFNREGNWKLTPDDITGFIQVPSSAISIIPTGVSALQGLTIRGQFIYDTYNHTNDLRDRVYTDPAGNTYIEFSFITELGWDDLPPIAREAITYTARRLFAQDLEVDEKRYTFQAKDEKQANVALLREHTRNDRKNSIRNNAAISNFISKVGGPNSRSSRYVWDNQAAYTIE